MLLSAFHFTPSLFKGEALLCINKLKNRDIRYVFQIKFHVMDMAYRDNALLSCVFMRIFSLNTICLS